MDKTEEVKDRIDKAVERIKAASGTSAELSMKLKKLEEARKNDLAELDALVAELKPLVEED